MRNDITEFGLEFVRLLALVTIMIVTTTILYELLSTMRQ